MAPEHPGKASQAEFDIIQNRIALALAKRESLVKSWTASSPRAQEPTKTEAELDAEDALHFRKEPPNLGVGAPIPSHFLVSEAQQNNKSLRAKFFPTKGLKASKVRDAEEKAASAKRALRDESSDEEEGRSGLGKAKKQKIGKHMAATTEDKETQGHSILQSDLGVHTNQTTRRTGMKISDKEAQRVPEVSDKAEAENSAENNIAESALVSSTASHKSLSLATANPMSKTNSELKDYKKSELSGEKAETVTTRKEEVVPSTGPVSDARKAKLKLKKKKEKRERREKQRALAAKS